MIAMPFVADRGMLNDANGLLADYGDDAGFEAAARAERFRAIGNVTDFCRWRQIERLVLLLCATSAQATVH